MSVLLIFIHVVICIALIMIVLLQTGKGADMGAVFGGGGSQTLFGSGGASTFLGKATTVAAIVFMLTSFALAFISGHHRGNSVILNKKPAAERPAAGTAPPAVPGTPDSGSVPPATAKPPGANTNP
jgi:preprotein translocase subunit SecG